MARQWLCLFLCFQVAGFCTSLFLSQTPGHILAQTKTRTEIKCHVKKDHYGGVYWYRWSEESQLFQFLVFINSLGKATYGRNVSSEKFQVHGGRSPNSHSLQIQQLGASDNGTYYCTISQSSELLLGTGTRLGVVEVLPLPPLPTRAAASSRKPRRCVPRSKPVPRTGYCSPFVWVPLATCTLALLLCLAAAGHRFHRLRRRLWLRIQTRARPWQDKDRGNVLLRP